ncbi:hypothetical protein ACSU64_24895 [Bacillaceae bacterium C204]|uniref:hypothetical protein n=1 Tax=Neobacillus sp. 204 TaxID=3383351 RepID=UPI00397A716A
MQNVAKDHSSFLVEIEATAHAWRMPFVALFEKLFRAGDAVRIGKTTLFVKDHAGNVLHQEYYGKSRKEAWYRKLEIEQKMTSINKEEFLKWLTDNK